MSKPEVPKADAAVAAQTDEKTVASASALTDADEAEKHAMEPEESAADRDFSPSSKKSRDDSPPYSNQAKLALSNQNSRDKFWFELCRMKEEEYNDMSIPDFLRVKCGNPHEKSIFSKRLEWYRSLKSQGSAENQPPPSPPAATANKPGETDSNSEQAETKESGKSSPGANAGNNHNPSAPPASDNNYLATAQMQQYNQAYQQYHMHSHHHYMQNQQGSQQQGQYPGYPPSFPGMPPPWALHHAPPGERGPNASPPQGGQHHVAPGMPPGIPPGMMPYHYPSATQPPFSASQPSGGGSGGDSLSKTSAKEGNLPDSKQPERQNPKGISPEGRLVVSEIKEILGLSEEDSETGEIKAGQSTDAEKLRGTDDIPPMGCRDTDVLFGRGGAMRKHHGNVVFRGLVKKCQPAYIGAAEKNDKMLIARLIIQAVRKLGGRFLKKNDKTGVWEDVDEFRVRTKISQALREGAPQLRGTTMMCYNFHVLFLYLTLCFRSCSFLHAKASSTASNPNTRTSDAQPRSWWTPTISIRNAAATTLSSTRDSSWCGSSTYVASLPPSSRNGGSLTISIPAVPSISSNGTSRQGRCKRPRVARARI
mmetsp:Transcript_18604/g.43362  ORF Transcript_18604/g.43362 Transcript_18604/m.43362 type:complete len:593 (+) Transcript_18604:82-1860(+)